VLLDLEVVDTGLQEVVEEVTGQQVALQQQLVVLDHLEEDHMLEQVMEDLKIQL
jgi:hypothetical protein